MIQDARPSLHEEALAKFLRRFGERLDGNLATYGVVHSPVDDTHAANAQDAQDWIFADLSDCRSGIHATHCSCSMVLNRLKPIIDRGQAA